MVYGGGGAFGIAYGLGVAHGLAETGLPVATAPALGTSAGSWVASAVALGLAFDAFDDVDAPSVPTRDRNALVDAARSVFGDARHPLVAASAVSLRSGRRHILDGGRYPLADIVAASSAVPGLFPPHRIEGRLYIDGGMWSATSVDAATNADHVIVVAPIAGRVLGPMGRTAELLLARELRAWRGRHPTTRITMIRPDRQISRMAGRNPLGLFDDLRARPVYPLALEQGRLWGARLRPRPAA
jgi:NTE family protein